MFYTNSRYAKVGGLPPSELNQLELQFLLLNDFRLAIPIEEMQRYGDRLLVYSENKEQINLNLAAEAQSGVAHPAATPAVAPAEASSGGSAKSVDGERSGANGTGEHETPRADAPASASGESGRATVPPTEAQGGTAVVRGASEAMEVDDDPPAPPAATSNDGPPSASRPAPMTTPIVPAAPSASTAPPASAAAHVHPPAPSAPVISTSPTASRAVSFQRAERPVERERERAEAAVGPGVGAGLRWGGAAEGLVTWSS